MTKLSRWRVNGKSTAYNQTGQNFFQQLSVYNSMSSHLRRVLLAKSVVDARSKCYTSRRGTEQRRITDKRSKFRQKEDIPDEIIEKLAYDTRHHPAELIKMSLETKCTSERRGTEFGQCFSEHKIQENPPGRSCCRSKKSSRDSSDPDNRNPLQPMIVACSKKSTETRSPPKSEDYYSVQRYEEDFEESDSDALTSGTTNRCSTLSGSSRSCGDDRRHRRTQSRETETSRRIEEARYAGFVYEITKEIMRDGLYRDEQLKAVFKRHLEMNKGILDMSKMLYEIHQLKISLNIAHEPDVNDDLEDLIEAQQMLRIAEIRPPTPPKVLDDNKIMEKLISYQQNPETGRRSSIGGKSVLLVDPNPELVITEKDILLSLMEANIEPKQAHRICRSLFHRSRNASSHDTIEGKRARDKTNQRGKGDIAVDPLLERKNEETGQEERHS